jgi:phosphohistidine phosphatase SixA
LLLMRHASAGERLESPVKDRARRLDAAGRADARALPTAFADVEIERIVSSPTARCVATVLSLARRRRIEIECRDELGPDASRKDILALLAELPETTLVCTHREVLERLFRGTVTCEKGGTWLVERKGRRRVPVAVAYLPPPSSEIPRLPRASVQRATRPRSGRLQGSSRDRNPR